MYYLVLYVDGAVEYLYMILTPKSNRVKRLSKLDIVPFLHCLGKYKRKTPTVNTDPGACWTQ